MTDTSDPIIIHWHSFFDLWILIQSSSSIFFGLLLFVLFFLYMYVSLSLQETLFSLFLYVWSELYILWNAVTHGLGNWGKVQMKDFQDSRITNESAKQLSRDASHWFDVIHVVEACYAIYYYFLLDLVPGWFRAASSTFLFNVRIPFIVPITLIQIPSFCWVLCYSC